MSKYMQEINRLDKINRGKINQHKGLGNIKIEEKPSSNVEINNKIEDNSGEQHLSQDESADTLQSANHNNPENKVFDRLEAILKSTEERLEKQEQSHREQLEKQEEARKKEIDGLKGEIEKLSNTIDRYDDLAKLNGIAEPVKQSEAVKDADMSGKSNFPQVNLKWGVELSDRATGLVKDFFCEYKKADTGHFRYTRTGAREKIVNHRQLDNFMAIPEVRQNILREAEPWFQSAGLIKGNGLIKSSDAPTSGADLIDGFLPFLESYLRGENRTGFIWYQFPNYNFNFAANVGDTMQIARSPYRPEPRSSDDRLLSGRGTFVDINPDTQPITTSTVSVILREWGMGRTGLPGDNGRPIAIPQFVTATSLYELTSILNTDLFRDYAAFEDIFIREQYEKMSQLDADGDNIYVKGNDVVQDVTSLTAGDGGRLNDIYLINLYSFLQANEVLPLLDNCYVLVLNTTTLADLNRSIRERYVRLHDIANLEGLMNVMKPNMVSENFKVEGYVGKVDGFHIWAGNSWGVKSLAQLTAAGLTTVPEQQKAGVQEKTVDGTPVVFRSNYVFGRQTVARAVSKPFSIIPNSDNNYGRLTRYIWQTYEGVDPLDISPTVDAGASQQRRAFRLLCSETEI